MFNEVGTISSINRKADVAHIDFVRAADAQKALNRFNYTFLDQKEISVRLLLNEANEKENKLIIKNLDIEIGNRLFFEIFSVFGDVTFSKVPVDPFGKSLGFGVLTYSQAETTKKVKETCTFERLLSKKIEILHYHNATDHISPKTYKTELGSDKKLRKNSESDQESDKNSVFVKKIPKTLSQMQLIEIFNPFGQISSIFYPKNTKTEPIGYALVRFASQSDAEKAIDNLRVAKPFDMLVEKAQKRHVRKEKKRFSLLKNREEIDVKTAGRNVVVNHVPAPFCEEAEIMALFSPFGRIESLKVNRKTSVAYVLFESVDNAVTSIRQLSGRLWDQQRPNLGLVKTRLFKRKSDLSRVQNETVLQALQNSAVSFTYAKNQLAIAPRRLLDTEELNLADPALDMAGASPNVSAAQIAGMLEIAQQIKLRNVLQR